MLNRSREDSAVFDEVETEVTPNAPLRHDVCDGALVSIGSRQPVGTIAGSASAVLERPES